MKKLYILFVFTLCSTTYLSAQLQVLSNGNAKFTKNVGIGTDPDDYSFLNIYHISHDTPACFGIKIHLKTSYSMPTSPLYGVSVLADAWSATSNYPISPIVGIYGKAIKSTSTIVNFSAGIAGMADYYGGIGIYGGLGNENCTLPSSWKGGAYAGYFDGRVNIEGLLTATNISTTSDLRLKENIKYIDKTLMDYIRQLRPISYKFKYDSTYIVHDNGDDIMQRTHYGLIAQEVQELYPDIVYRAGDGTLSINYIELIPLLIGSIQELKTEIDELRTQQSASEMSAHRLVANTSSDIVAKLYQNTPNPFNQSTTILYDLPLETLQAVIYIYDMSGLQIAAYGITELGSGSITIPSSNLQAGIYLYSLIADGQVIDTKQMILTK